jgi:hypothetical protein
VPTLETAFVAVAFGFVLALAATVAIHLLTGAINTRGLLRVKAPRAREELSPARVQLLLASLAVAGAWLSRVAEARDAGTLPEVPMLWLAALGASEGGYLATKLQRFVNIGGALRRILRLEGP